MLSLFIALFIFSSTESHVDMINKAKRLTLQRDREKALQILNLSLNNKNLKQEQKKELVLAINTISEMFLQDKTQRLYAKAQAQKEDDPQMALESLKEAQSLERHNLSIYLEKAKIEILDKDCRNEEKTAEEALNWNPYHKKLQLVYLQALVCREAEVPEGFLLNVFNSDGADFFYMEALHFYLLKKYGATLNSLGQGLKHGKNLANYYWLKDKVLDKQEIDRSSNQDMWQQACMENKKRSPVYLDVCTKKQATWSIK